jgi:acyl dehydratase
MTVTIAVADLAGAIGRELAVSDWVEVTQAMIDEFADATRDAQWIHVDTARAARESPFTDAQGRPTTVAHGFLTLSLLTALIENGLHFDGARAGVNVGFERVRFVAPVPAGSRLRGRFTLARVAPVRGGVQLAWRVTVECEGAVKPALTAEWLTRLLV